MEIFFCVGAGGSGAASGGAAGKGSKAGGKASNDFSVQYAKSSRSECVGCMEFIPKGDVRISKKDYTSEKALMFAQGTGLVSIREILYFRVFT